MTRHKCLSSFFNEIDRYISNLRTFIQLTEKMNEKIPQTSKQTSTNMLVPMSENMLQEIEANRRDLNYYRSTFLEALEITEDNLQIVKSRQRKERLNQLKREHEMEIDDEDEILDETPSVFTSHDETGHKRDPFIY